MPRAIPLAATPALILGLAVALMAPSILVRPGWVDAAYLNYVWVKQFGEALAQGIAYPRWLPDSFDGAGSATFYFYPPLAFYVAGGLQALGLPTLNAIGVAAGLGMAASGVTMAGWLRFKGLNPLWALAYMAAPYHLHDWYARSAFAEFMAYAWLPVIALALEAMPRRWAPPLLAAAYAGLILTHLPMAVLASALLIPPLAWRARQHIVHCALALTVGMALAGVYLLPALTLQHHVSLDHMWPAYFQPATWSIWGNRQLLWALPIALAAIAVAVGGNRFWLWMTAGTLAMAFAVVPALWTLPILERVQFPWRALALVEFAAVTAAATVPHRRLWVTTVALLAAFLSWFGTSRLLVDGLQTPTPPVLGHQMQDALEYLPRGSVLSHAVRADLSVDRTAIAPATLTDAPVPEVAHGETVSLVALLAWLALVLRALPRRSRAAPWRPQAAE